MKKWISAVLAVIMVLSLFGCSSSQNETTSGGDTKQEDSQAEQVLKILALPGKVLSMNSGILTK